MEPYPAEYKLDLPGKVSLLPGMFVETFSLDPVREGSSD